MVNGVRDGAYRAWHQNGVLRAEGTFKDGKLHGEYRMWNWDGTPLRLNTYDNGKRLGLYKEWVTTDVCMTASARLYDLYELPW